MEEAIKRQDKIDALENERDARNRSQDSINSNLAKQLVQEQINSLNETRKQFELENRPFLQIADIIIDSVENQKMPIATYEFVNFGKFPAKVLYISSSLTIDLPDQNKILNITAMDSVISNNYLSGNTNIQGKTPLKKNITEAGVVAYKNRKAFFYLRVSFSYKSFSPNKIYSTRCFFKIGHNEPLPSVEALINEEREEPSTAKK